MTITPVIIVGIVVISIAVIVLLVRIGLIGALCEIIGDILGGLFDID